jgi:hypothetical protein
LQEASPSALVAARLCGQRYTGSISGCRGALWASSNHANAKGWALPTSPIGSAEGQSSRTRNFSALPALFGLRRAAAGVDNGGGCA